MPTRIQDWQLQRKADRLLLGLATSVAILDIETDDSTLRSCAELLRSSPPSRKDLPIGKFGSFQITIATGPGVADETTKLWIDGPKSNTPRTQSAMIRVHTADLLDIIDQVTTGLQDR
ncbi:MAG TPA: hypothetical protein PKE29_17035 [Phycisphaerales bacterium]|nr:hypothetical protein [Phycisphaerales bacterium]